MLSLMVRVWDGASRQLGSFGHLRARSSETCESCEMSGIISVSGVGPETLKEELR